MKYFVVIGSCMLCLSLAHPTLAQTVVPPAHKADSVLNKKDHTYYRDPIRDTTVKTHGKIRTDSFDRRKRNKTQAHPKYPK